MSGLRVVHLCRGRDWRGGERQVLLLARMLARRSDLAQTVATGAGSRLACRLRVEGVAVLELPWSVAYHPRAALTLVRQLHQLTRESPQLLLHAHDSHALALGCFAARRSDLPLIATRRSVSPPSWLWRRPERVISISRAVVQSLRSGGVPETRLVLVHSAVDLEGLRRVVPARHSEGPFLIAVGAFTPEKGHATLIEAFALLAPRHPELRLLLLGEGSERASLEARARRLGAASRIIFAGNVVDTASLIAAAEHFIQPSYREALGTAVLDAMALGVPVIASNTGGLAELVGGGAGLLVPPGDPAALAGAMERLLATPALRAELVRVARTRVAEFDAPGMAERVVEVYRSALGDT